MELSEDQLRDVFETLDSEGLGFVSMDQLVSFAQNAGFADVSALESIETDEDGYISFDQFAEGVRALTQSASHLYGTQEHHVEHEVEHHEDGHGHHHEEEHDHHEVADLNTSVGGISPEPITPRPSSRHSRGSPTQEKAPTPDASPAHGSGEAAPAALPMDVSILRAQLDKVIASRTQLSDELGDVRMKYSILQKRCGEYEAQLEAADELSREGEEAIAMLEHVTKAKQELEEKEQAQREKLKIAEEQLFNVSAERDRLQALVDATYKGEEDLLKKLETVEKKLMKAEAELLEQKENFDARLNHHLAQTQEKMERALDQQKTGSDEKERGMLEELEIWKAKFEEEEREKLSIKAEMENELLACQNRLQVLENCLSDPKEYERQFVLKGMAMANERPETLADELQEATKEDLVEQVKQSRKQVTDLQFYIDILLARVMERIPDILESKTPSKKTNDVASKENQGKPAQQQQQQQQQSPAPAPTKPAPPAPVPTRAAPPARPIPPSPETQAKSGLGGFLKGKGSKAPTREAPKK